jgi:tetratricopeptide (TPR) repeat protein
LVDSKGKLIGGRWDDLSAFSNPRRKDATLLWFTKGDITYSFPKPKQLDSLEELKFIAEISSEKGGSAENWPSPISFYIGNLKLGDWTIPGDPGDRYGKVAKHPLPIGASQYGWLVTLDVRKDGTYLKTLFNGKESEKKVSNVTIEDVKKVIGSQKNVNLKIVVKGNPASGTGINIYGKGWGDYDVNPTVEYVESSKSQKEDRIGELEKRAIIGYSTKTVKFGDQTYSTFQVPVLDVTQKVNLKFGKYERLMPNGEKITVTVPESVEEVGVTPTAQPTTETINIENPGKPERPNRKDYIDPNTGKLDREAYAEAMAKYKEDLAAYRTALKTYRSAVKAVRLEARGEWKSLQVEQRAIKTVNRALSKLVKGEQRADKYVARAELTLQRAEDYRNKAEELRSEANERATALLGEGWTMDDLKAKLEKPNKSDFIDPETGKVDREAYNKAMAEYKEARAIDKLFSKADKYELRAERLEERAGDYQKRALELSEKTVESFKTALEKLASEYKGRGESLRTSGEGLLSQAEKLEGAKYYEALGKGEYEAELAEGYERGAEIATAVLETYVNVDVTSNPDVADSLESVDISNININI